METKGEESCERIDQIPGKNLPVLPVNILYLYLEYSSQSRSIKSSMRLSHLEPLSIEIVFL